MIQALADRQRMLYCQPAFYRLVLIMQTTSNAGLREYAAQTLLDTAALPAEGH